MKKIIAVCFTLFAFAGIAAEGNLKGEILLKGQHQSVTLRVDVLDSKTVIRVGEDNFTVSSRYADNLEGYLDNGVEDKNIQIIRNQDQLDQFKANLAQVAAMLANADDLYCDELSNAFILISNNKTMEMNGNCVILKEAF